MTRGGSVMGMLSSGGTEWLVDRRAGRTALQEQAIPLIPMGILENGRLGVLLQLLLRQQIGRAHV